MCGEYKTKDNEKEVVDIHLQIYDDRNTIKKQLKTRTKILLGSVFLLIFAIFTFLAYYFFNSYDSVKIYTIESKDDKIYLTDGAIVLTGENIYFRLGNINGIAEESISKIIVYYYYNNTKRKIYESDSAKDGLIRDYYEYNEYFEVKNKDVLFNSLYADIYFEKDFKTIKLIMKEDYSNKRFFFQKHKSVLPEHVEPININNQNIDCSFGQNDNAEVVCRLDNIVLEKIVQGNQTFQGAFMSGSMTARGNFKNIRMLDPVPSVIRDYVRTSDVELRQNCDNLSAVLNEMCKDTLKKDRLLKVVRGLPENDVKDIEFITMI